MSSNENGPDGLYPSLDDLDAEFEAREATRIAEEAAAEKAHLDADVKAKKEAEAEARAADPLYRSRSRSRPHPFPGMSDLEIEDEMMRDSERRRQEEYELQDNIEQISQETIRPYQADISFAKSSFDKNDRVEQFYIDKNDEASFNKVKPLSLDKTEHLRYLKDLFEQERFAVNALGSYLKKPQPPTYKEHFL